MEGVSRVSTRAICLRIKQSWARVQPLPAPHSRYELLRLLDRKIFSISDFARCPSLHNSINGGIHWVIEQHECQLQFARSALQSCPRQTPACPFGPMTAGGLEGRHSSQEPC